MLLYVCNQVLPYLYNSDTESGEKSNVLHDREQVPSKVCTKDYDHKNRHSIIDTFKPSNVPVIT